MYAYAISNGPGTLLAHGECLPHELEHLVEDARFNGYTMIFEFVR